MGCFSEGPWIFSAPGDELLGGNALDWQAKISPKGHRRGEVPNIFFKGSNKETRGDTFFSPDSTSWLDITWYNL